MKSKPMWYYHQSSGRLTNNYIFDGYFQGYSGKGKGKNNPEMQSTRDIGPIPIGKFVIGKAFNHHTKGPLCMRLIPNPTNNMFGRDGFMMHGDSISHPGEASDGCIILDHKARLLVSNSTDKELEVIS